MLRRLIVVTAAMAVAALAIWARVTFTPEPVEPSTDLIALQFDGGVAVVRPDGSDLRDLVRDIEASYLLPTWSRDGSSVAVGELHDDGTTRLVVVDAADGAVAATETRTLPFYLSWSPSGDRIVYLANAPGGGGIEARLAVPAGDDRLLDTGAPFYLAWAPDGESLLVHVGTERLDVLDPATGSSTAVGLSPGMFRAPQVDAAGRFLVTIRRAGFDRLAVLDGVEPGPDLAVFDGSATFSWAPDGRTIALQVTGGPSPGFLSTQSSAVPLDRLVVRRADTAGITQVSAEPALGFWWSPVGERLLYVTLDRGDDGSLLLQWNVWEDGENRELDRFLPTRTFTRDFLPFFDQFALSMSLWSPDGTAFTYTGASEGGEVGAFVRSVEADEPATLVATGAEFAVWSPS